MRMNGHILKLDYMKFDIMMQERRRYFKEKQNIK